MHWIGIKIILRLYLFHWIYGFESQLFLFAMNWINYSPIILLIMNCLKTLLNQIIFCFVSEGKDPFEFNSTNVEQTGVETPFCASGQSPKAEWFSINKNGKIIFLTMLVLIHYPHSSLLLFINVKEVLYFSFIGKVTLLFYDWKSIDCF